MKLKASVFFMVDGGVGIWVFCGVFGGVGGGGGGRVGGGGGGTKYKKSSSSQVHTLTHINIHRHKKKHEVVDIRRTNN